MAVSPTVKVLVVGGGGGGGGGALNLTVGGGGGAGGFQYDPVHKITAGSYSVTVGGGGAGGAAGGPNNGTSGSNSVFDTITANGGGGGDGQAVGGISGGSGGGGAGHGTSRSPGGAGTLGQGNIGGRGQNNYGGGGGGGASKAGTDGTPGSGNGGVGGDGISNSVSGSAVTYGGGGGGGGLNNAVATGGAGGGGAGAGNISNAVAGTANTGGGGGGGGDSNGASGAGAAGGSGIVIIAFPTNGSTGISTSSTGGTITTVGGFQIHTFTSNGTFTCVTTGGQITAAPGAVKILAVAGGGGGGTGSIAGTNGGGGGGGGVVYDARHQVAESAYSVTVGAGGSGGITSFGTGNNGGDSIFDTITATGGGGGGGVTPSGGGGASPQPGANGGCGGGASGNGNGTQRGGFGSQGAGGGTSSNTGSPGTGAGGGGAGHCGFDGKNDSTGSGGNGVASSISGASVTYAGGGAGYNGTAGGSGGGGGSTANGSANTGGGGGGNINNSGNGGNGGSGIVIISYASDGSDGIDPANTTGGTITTSGGQTIHTFTSNGTFTVVFVRYTLTYLAGANGTISGSASQSVLPGQDGTAVTAVPNTGYHFTSWSDGVLTASRTDTNNMANLTVTASFAINTYTLTYNAGANGSIVGSNPQTVNYGANGSTVVATPNPGYVFDSWSDGYPTASRTDLNVTMNITVTAFFGISSLSDVLCGMVASAYKWLTQTLFNTQQSQTVRPFFTAQVIDDTIQPKAQLFSGGGTPVGNGSMAVAPDGTAFSLGLDGSNNLNVYRAPNLDAVGGVFPNFITLNTAGDNFLDSRNVFSIKISDNYKGKYRICVWYFGNFTNDGTNLKVILQYSDDGGLTFTKVNFTPVVSNPNNALGNVSIAAMKPVFTISGQVKMGAFYLIKNGTTFTPASSNPNAPTTYNGYDVYYIYGDTSNGYSVDTPWAQEVNSKDWTLHSLSSFYLNGRHHCVFSGFRNIIDSPGVNANYSLWVTSVINLTGSIDLWSSPVPVLPVGSASDTNKNQFILPFADTINGLVYVTARAILVDSISQTSQGSNAQVVTTHINYVLVNSDNGEGFSYPTILTGSDGSEFNSGGVASFILQNGFWFLGGALGWLWEFTQNNVVADISQEVIGFSINDVAGQPSSINIQLANANNKWVGASPTGPGAAAIAKNKKIALWQGYYNPDGSSEVVPHSTYYIDDINQIITGTQNDVTLVGRDFYKKLKTNITRFSYQFTGPVFFSDIFDQTFVSSWNQVAGAWVFTPGSPPILVAPNVSSEVTMMLINTNADSYGHLMRIFFQVGNAGKVYIYGFYIDNNNYLRLELNNADGVSWAVVQRINGVNTTLDSGNLPFTMGSNNFYGVYVRRYSYLKFNFMISNGEAIGNDLSDYNPATSSYLFKNSGSGEYDMSGAFQGNASLQKLFTVGFGSSSPGTGSPRNFRFFMFTTFSMQNNLRVLMGRIARIAGIFAFKIKYTWRELLFQPSFTGTFTVANRILKLTASNQAVSNGNSMANGEISFLAKCTPTNPASNQGFRFVFRYTNSGNDTYYFHIIQASTGSPNPPTFTRFERLFNSIIYQFYNTPYDVSNNQSQLGSANLDLNKWNLFRIVMIDGWFHAFVNGVMFASWNDNNTTSNYLTTGQWGFLADANTTLQVQNILAPDFWKPVQSFSFNPGDDAESSLKSLLGSLRAWFFSDLMSRFKAIFLNSSDPSTYNYNTQLFQQNVDGSDKEYVSQITVYGDGVMATARNTNLMPGVQVREEVIVDYTINNQQDAQTRANNELINANQYRNQYSPKQVINVGAELFDAVTIVNTGNNTSGVNEVTRVYAELFNAGGGNNNSDYSLEIQTGNL